MNAYVELPLMLRLPISELETLDTGLDTKNSADAGSCSSIDDAQTTMEISELTETGHEKDNY